MRYLLGILAFTLLSCKETKKKDIYFNDSTFNPSCRLNVKKHIKNVKF